MSRNSRLLPTPDGFAAQYILHWLGEADTYMRSRVSTMSIVKD